MDRRYVLAFAFSLIILLAYPYYLKMIGVSTQPKTTYEQSEPKLEAEIRPSAAQPTTPSLSEKRTEIPYRNDLYEIVFSNTGGNIVYLKQGDKVFYKAGPGDPGIFGVRVLHETQDTAQEFFKVLPAEGTRAAMQFVYEKSGEYRLVKKYFAANDRPSFVMEVELENLSTREKNFPLQLEYGLELDEADHQDEQKIKIVRFSSGDAHVTHLGAIKKKPLVTSEPLEWQGLIKKYYALLVKPNSKLIGQRTRLDEGKLVSTLNFSPINAAPGEKKQLEILIYAGPEQYETLKEFGVGFEKIFSSGMLGILRVSLLKTLKFFYKLTHNYGVAILLLTLIIKLLFTPFSHLSYQSMEKMQALQPKIKALQKQYQKDTTRLNKETMELYRRNKVNPMMGCLPMVLQIPIFIAFYQVLSEAVELKGAYFVGWINDLSAPDRLFIFPFNLPFVGDSFNLLPLFMLGSMLWQQKLTPQTSADPMQAKIMYLMPVVFGFVFYNLPSGLVLYWTANNLLTIFHQLVIKKVPIILHHEDT